MLVKNVEKLEKSKVSFSVECDAEEFEKALQSAYLKSKSKISVPGFRKGKAPRMVVEGMYGKEVFYEDAMDELLPAAFQFAVDQEKLRAVGTPTLKSTNVSEEKVLSAVFETAVWPEAELGEYKGLEAPRPNVEITDEQVDRDLERTRSRQGRMEVKERPAEDGDTVDIDYVGTIDGVAFDGGSAEGYSLLLGSNSFIPGFEAQLVGISAGEEKDIEVTFPEDYHAEELKGKPAVFHVKCNAVKFVELPELDDEFAKDVSEFDTLEEYKQSIRTRLAEAAAYNADEEFHSALLDKAAANMTAEIPDEMVEAEVDRVINEMKQNLEMQGLSLEMYLQYLNMDMGTLRTQYRASAQQRCRVQVLLDKVASVEEFTFTDEEIEAEYQRVADEYSTDIETVRKAVPVDAVTDDMRLRRASEVIFDSGIAVEPVEEELPAVETEVTEAAEE